MAFALSKFRAYGTRANGPQPARGIQYIEIRATGTSADVVLDLGDFDGTFWGDVDATDLGTKALEVIQLIEAQVVACGVDRSLSPQLADRLQVGSLTTTGQFLIDYTDSDVPNISVNAADGETSWIIVLAALLADGIEPINCSIG